MPVEFLVVLDAQSANRIGGDWEKIIDFKHISMIQLQTYKRRRHEKIIINITCNRISWM